jgi:general secretion pathway protein G
MVMTIVLILIAVSVTSYQQIQLKARETVLKQNLMAMRKAIDEFAADRERLPSSLEDLATAHYINEVPIDPITGEADWEVETGEDTISRDGGTGVIDVHSSASGADSEGKAYSEY